jgi:UDP-N-acetylenolpyruvoylglucosamine reductase
VIGLIQKVRRMIKRKTGVRLDLELKIVGEA